MGDYLVSFQALIASSSANLSSATTFVQPMLYLAFAAVVAVSIMYLVGSIIWWLGHKISNLFSGVSKPKSHGIMYDATSGESKKIEW